MVTFTAPVSDEPTCTQAGLEVAVNLGQPEPELAVGPRWQVGKGVTARAASRC